jgi:hypothetical protein
MGLAVFFLIFFVDSISRESADPVKLIGVTIMATLYVTILFVPGLFSLSAAPGGGAILHLTEPYVFAYFLMVFVPSLVLVYYFTKLLWKAPKNLKKYALICFVGVLVGYPLAAIFATFTSLKILIPGFSVILVVLGNLLMAIAFATQSKLAFILPFKALRLTVIHTDGGISVFSHTWSKMDDLIDEQLFSGTLQAISQILDESLKSGSIRSIEMDQATLIIERFEEFPVVFVLVTTKTSRSLRSALHSFSDRFLKDLGSYLSAAFMSEKFEPAEGFVEDYFQFIPEYD